MIRLTSQLETGGKFLCVIITNSVMQVHFTQLFHGTDRKLWFRLKRHQNTVNRILSDVKQVETSSYTARERCWLLAVLFCAVRDLICSYPVPKYKQRQLTDAALALNDLLMCHCVPIKICCDS